MTSRKNKILDDPILAKLVREGVITPATHEGAPLPPRKPIMTLDKLMKELDADREDRI